MGIPCQRFLLRWRFEYEDRNPKFGMWHDSGRTIETQAWPQTRTGLRRAMIEAKNITTRETKVIVDCPSQDFRLFQWIGMQRLNPKTTGLVQKNIGLCIVTNDARIEAYDWGEVRTRPLVNGEKNINFRTDGR